MVADGILFMRHFTLSGLERYRITNWRQIERVAIAPIYIEYRASIRMRIVSASGLWRWEVQRIFTLTGRRFLTKRTVGVLEVIVAIMDGLGIAGRLALIRGLPSRAETSRIRHRFGGKGSEEAGCEDEAIPGCRGKPGS
jgi:hypothetical protein